MQLAGKAALVTGAGRRVGRALAVGLAAAGCDVAVHYSSSSKGAEETASEIKKLGRKATLIHADLRDAAAARGLADQAARAFGHLDVLINAAAVMVKQAILDVTPESWDATLDLNLRAYFFVAQGAVAHLKKVRGKIVNIADVGGLEPWPTYIPHSVSKAGVVMLTKGLAKALAPEITVNAVAPGPVLLPDDWDDATRQRFAETTPLGLGTPEHVVNAVRYLLEGGDYVTGTVLVVDGGRMLR